MCETCVWPWVSKTVILQVCGCNQSPGGKDVIKNAAVRCNKKAMPEKRTADNRIADFDEIYNDFVATAAETQASRCSQCGVPFCQVNCPL